MISVHVDKLPDGPLSLLFEGKPVVMLPTIQNGRPIFYELGCPRCTLTRKVSPHRVHANRSGEPFVDEPMQCPGCGVAIVVHGGFGKAVPAQ